MRQESGLKRGRGEELGKWTKRDPGTEPARGQEAKRAKRPRDHMA